MMTKALRTYLDAERLSAFSTRPSRPPARIPRPESAKADFAPSLQRFQPPAGNRRPINPAVKPTQVVAPHRLAMNVAQHGTGAGTKYFFRPA